MLYLLVGFDPLGFTNVFDVKWYVSYFLPIFTCNNTEHIFVCTFLRMREAELKHCRVAMLAALGFIIQELWTFPYPYFSKVPPVIAHGEKYSFVQLFNNIRCVDVYVKTGGMSQILLFVIFFEVISLFAVSQMMEGKREPGVFHFDPLGLAKDPETFRKYEWSELRNGRLAMIAVGKRMDQFYEIFVSNQFVLRWFHTSILGDKARYI